MSSFKLFSIILMIFHNNVIVVSYQLNDFLITRPIYNFPYIYNKNQSTIRRVLRKPFKLQRSTNEDLLPYHQNTQETFSSIYLYSFLKNLEK